MSFRKRAGGGKRDAIEPAVIQALEACGVRCWRIGGTGNPDVLTLSPIGRYLPLEVKSGKAGLTKNQADIPWPIVRSVAEALALFGW